METLYVICPRCGQTDEIQSDKVYWEAMCLRCNNRFRLTGLVVQPNRPSLFTAARLAVGRQMNRHLGQVCLSAVRALGRSFTGDRRPSGFLVRLRGTDRPGPAEWTGGTVIIDDFVVERKLGQGGMGVVHLIRDWASGRKYAVK